MSLGEVSHRGEQVFAAVAEGKFDEAASHVNTGQNHISAKEKAIYTTAIVVFGGLSVVLLAGAAAALVTGVGAPVAAALGAAAGVSAIIALVAAGVFIYRANRHNIKTAVANEEARQQRLAALDAQYKQDEIEREERRETSKAESRARTDAKRQELNDKYQGMGMGRPLSSSSSSSSGQARRDEIRAQDGVTRRRRKG
ncbi:MAG: hypothetical protein KDK62_04640 [Chlamydiia bacterium]|nr:hypothetical protein [Chlamydiia bacterium]